MRKALVLSVALTMGAWVLAPAAAAAGHRGNATAYCLTGTRGWVHTTTARVRAEGHLGMVAVPRVGRRGHVPLGTVLVVDASPWGPGTVVAADRIGHGSELDFALPGACHQARQWGRQHVQVRPETPAEGVAREAAR